MGSLAAWPWPAILAGLSLGYGLGSIPFGLLLTRAAGLGDIRGIGSGNIGATNVLRTGNKALAAVTLLLDALKGTAAILLARALLGPEAGLAAAIGAFLGHCFPIWLGFRGGKGVATFMGCLLALDWRAFVAFALVWLAAAFGTRYSSVGGLSASLVSALLPWWLGDPATSGALLVLTAILWLKHRPNIERLIAGTETKIGRKG
ncbi:glycerol-3-phosphate 1-O-acyltransferase PlsY [Enterovirga rhinocerotis]|uniref:Glycerol-3-phosphate acyltransferase n=1 Tax=Enterovirga rhinocerotis TaxID=1339210 RepID=A0A4R7C8W9_9HYPH|nr:glycerol-3-phosphate 1-O-acyltransferase PlsY [Enterovirga rhinocerotis]TDR94442.1 acyl-phosphate glycerol-3-phosphate acyltransferase [Enterovirga rhinocerotis]